MKLYLSLVEKLKKDGKPYKRRWLIRGDDCVGSRTRAIAYRTREAAGALLERCWHATYGDYRIITVEVPDGDGN